jgi:hypothetical protein
VIEREAASYAVEVKAGSGRDPDTARRPGRCLEDTGARRGFVVAQRRGVEPLGPRLERRGFDECLDWLPGG